MREYSSNGSLEAMHALVRAFWEAESQRKNTTPTLPPLLMMICFDKLLVYRRQGSGIDTAEKALRVVAVHGS